VPAPTADTLAEVLRPVTENARRAGVFLDIDGTLAPIVERAEDARVPDATRRAIEGLVPRYACIACVSGRAASEARRLVGIDSIAYAGSHGAELLEPGDASPTAPPAFEEWAPRVREFVAARELGDLRVEHKGAIVALHWRGADHEEPRVRAIAQDAEHAGFVTHWGRKVLEIRPPVEFDKGSAVSELMRRHELVQALYAGDDRTDLDAFAVVTVRVGIRSDEGPSEIAEQADVVVDGPEGFVAVLEAL
jgi:trehalose 6-phosphate phosphatase